LTGPELFYLDWGKMQNKGWLKMILGKNKIIFN